VKTIVIIGGTREAALKRLRKTAPDDGVVHSDFVDEATLDGHRIMAIGGGPGDVCWLRAVGFADVKIITVEDAAISEEMWRRIRHVRTTRT
jgi:hypothetical protein